MKYFIANPRFPQRNAHAHDILKMLGVKRLPPEGMSMRVIQGIEVWVVAQRPKLPTERKRHMHRVMCHCPGCRLVLTVGRLHQHKCKAVQP